MVLYTLGGGDSNKGKAAQRTHMSLLKASCQTWRLCPGINALVSDGASHPPTF